MSRADRRFHPAAVVVAVLGTVFLALAIVSEVVFHASIDPTEETFAVTLRNDTASVVVVRQCAATCRSFHERDLLEPGDRLSVNTSSDDVANWWSVRDAYGNTLGCWPLRYDHKTTGVVVWNGHRPSRGGGTRRCRCRPRLATRSAPGRPAAGPHRQRVTAAAPGHPRHHC